MQRLRAILAQHRGDERGVETVAMIIVIPVLFILIMGLLDVGMMLRARMSVENILRDAARQAAADGGNLNPRLNTSGVAWDTWAYKKLVKDGKCTVSGCDSTSFSVNCRTITTAAGVVYTNKNVADNAGDVITCTIVRYPYKGLNEPMLNSPLGLGIGGMLKDFTNMSTSARAEVGTNG